MWRRPGRLHRTTTPVIHCNLCHLKIEGDVERSIMLPTIYGVAHRDCGKRLRVADMYGGQFAPDVQQVFNFHRDND